MDNYVITVARGFGSGGKAISVALAKKLEIPCYEKEILAMASEKSGINKALFVERDERLKGSYLVNVMKSVPKDYTVEPSDRKFTHDNNLFNIQREIIEELAKNQSCIIIGKCADHILKDYPNVLKVFIDAPMADCIASIKGRMGVSEEEASRLIVKTDKYRSDYYKYYSGGKHWRNPVNYDVCFNSGFLGREKCVDLIMETLENKFNIKF